MRSCIISTNIKKVISFYLLLNKVLPGFSHTHTNRKRQDVAIKIAFVEIIICQRHHASIEFLLIMSLRSKLINLIPSLKIFWLSGLRIKVFGF